jgi:hypothetical protein
LLIIFRVSKIYVKVSGSHGGEYKDGCFGVVAPCNLVNFTDVSEMIAASIIRHL